MKTAVAIIGANFGDEGKGLMTDYFAKQNPKSLVIRFNGGAQAGHTVQLNDGTRHVFHHFGSGSLRGCDTYLSRYFIVNPLLYKKEYNGLNKLIQQYNSRTFIDDSCLITTPWDILLNQEIAKYNGHGSCGIGINETVERFLEGYIITWGDISTWNRKKIYLYLEMLAKEYVPTRLKTLEIKPSKEFNERLKLESIVEEFYFAIQIMYRTSLSMTLGEVKKWDNIIYEGAQGLCLDQNNDTYFPHVTRSNTGIRNVELLEQIIKSDKLEVVYVSRAYVTRHGNGYLPNEDKNLSYTDHTNIYNEFQGSLRYAPLLTDDKPIHLEREITNDIFMAPIKLPYKKNVLAITCLDQVDEKTRLSLLSHPFSPAPLRYISYGPTAEDIRIR